MEMEMDMTVRDGDEQMRKGMWRWFGDEGVMVMALDA